MSPFTANTASVQETVRFETAQKTLLSQLEEDLAIGVTAYKVKYGNDVSQMVWPAKAQVEEMHAGKNLDGLIAPYRPKNKICWKGRKQSTGLLEEACRRYVVHLSVHPLIFNTICLELAILEGWTTLWSTRAAILEG